MIFSMVFQAKSSCTLGYIQGYMDVLLVCGLASVYGTDLMFIETIIQIVVVVPDTGGTRCMVECPQCLGLQLFCSLLPSGSIAPPP